MFNKEEILDKIRRNFSKILRKYNAICCWHMNEHEAESITMFAKTIPTSATIRLILISH